MVSRYCQECLKFRQKKCQGKDKPRSKCRNYEFDVRLYEFPDGSKEAQPETIKEIRKRQIEKEIEEIQQQLNEATYNIVDVGKNLSSADFADLLL